MKKIIFGITNLNTGGAETTLADIANKLCNDYDITIFTLYSNNDLENNLSSKIKIINLFNKTFEELSFLNKKIISLKLFLFKNSIYKKYIKNNYDVEIAFLEGPITSLFSTKNKLTKKIAWVHTNISKIFGSGLKSKIKYLINKKTYSNYNKLIFVSSSALEDFNRIYENITVPKQVINNYIDADKIIEKSEQKIDFNFDNNSVNFLSVCRFVEAKALDRLAKIHFNLINNGFFHKIYLIGYGPLENSLKQLISSLNIENTFILLGKQANPFPYMNLCDYFLLSSYYEGLPLVLTESKILNKYILATNSASNEALDDYDYKKIVHNTEDAIYNGIKELILNKPKVDKNYSYNLNYILDEIKNIIECE